jgi:antitoxin (DNA-binding transcriptional repressor) of toxin-antitoxin stability system
VYHELLLSHDHEPEGRRLGKIRLAIDEVERGETLILTRHGRRIARIVPELDRRQEEIDKALAGIRGLRGRTGRITVGELLSARDQGRKS